MAKKSNDVSGSIIMGASMAATGTLIELVITGIHYMRQPDYREAAKEMYFDSINKRLELGPLVWK